MLQIRRTYLMATAPLLAMALLLAGCETKQQQGTVAGAVVGGAVGSLFGSGSGRVLAIGAGAVLGGIAGNQIGKKMDERDRREASLAMREAQSAPTGSGVNWNNPDSGNSGTIEVTREGTDGVGNKCREFKHTVQVDGETREDTGTACQRSDGKWVTIE